MQMKTKLIHSYLLALALVLFVGCNAWEEESQLRSGDAEKNLLEQCQSQTELSLFVTALQKTGYDKYVQQAPSLTVFAPTNQAMAAVNLSDSAALVTWIQDYIASLAYYTDQAGSFGRENIRMINDKNVPVSTSMISGANLLTSNIRGSNGVLHVIDKTIEARKSVWAYLQEYSDNEQVSFILSENKTVMDMKRSVQIGVDMIGRPVYDTVWTIQNEFLERTTLDAETTNFTVLLVEGTALNTLKTKYAKYFSHDNDVEKNKEVMRQITSDLLLAYTNISASGRYPSLEGVLVDVNPAAIVETYHASNGVVYTLNAVDVKMYNNKIKEQVIEAEEALEQFDGSGTRWLNIARPWARGGQTLFLKGRTNYPYDYKYYNVEKDSIEDRTTTFGTFYVTYRSSGDGSTTVNAYLKYEPVMYSVPYEISWVAYDDFYEAQRHYKVVDFGSHIDTVPMAVMQKMMISFPGRPVVKRNVDGTISNNFSQTTMMGAIDSAGIHTETTLTRYRKMDVIGETADLMYHMARPWTFSDDHGQNTTLNCPTYGKATLLVANTCNSTSNPGIMFLDYIRLKPLVDPND